LQVNAQASTVGCASYQKPAEAVIIQPKKHVKKSTAAEKTRKDKVTHGRPSEMPDKTLQNCVWYP
jgi:hypothetical protein